MLTRTLVSVLAAGLAAVLMLAAGQQAALAGGGPGGGNLVGSVTCAVPPAVPARASGGLSARCPGRGTVSRISRPFIRIREPCREPMYLSSASWGFRAS